MPKSIINTMKEYTIIYYRKVDGSPFPDEAQMTVNAFTKEGAFHKIKKFDKKATQIKEVKSLKVL